MVLLRFELDESVLEEDAAGDPATTDAALIESTYFVMPVRFAVDGVDLLAQDFVPSERLWVAGATAAQTEQGPSRPRSRPWMPLPIVSVAVLGRDVVSGLPTTRAAAYGLPGSGRTLRFQLVGADVRVESDVNARWATEPYDRVADAFDAFAGDVRRLLRESAPALLHHPVYAQWLRAD